MMKNFIHRLIYEESKCEDPRRMMLLVKGCPTFVHMNTWLLEPHEEHGEDAMFIVDYTAHGYIRMALRLADIIGVKFYSQ